MHNKNQNCHSLRSLGRDKPRPFGGRLCVLIMLSKTKYAKWPNGGCQALMTINLTDLEVVNLTGQKLMEGYDEGLGKWVGTGGDLPSCHRHRRLCHF